MTRLALSLALCTLVTGVFAQQSLPSRKTTKTLLFLTHAALYKHSSLAPAEQAVVDLGSKNGFEVKTLEGYKQDSRAIDLTMISPAYLAQFDGLMLMTNGNLPLRDDQKQAMVDYVRGGHALVGVHCATLTLYDFPAFGEMLGGYYRRSIIPVNAVAAGRTAVLNVEDRSNPATRMLGSSWALNEEFYQFGTEIWDPARPTENVSQVGRLHIPLAFTRDRVHVLLSLDTDRTDIADLGPEIKKGGDYPQAWTRQFGSGRVFYTALGHRDDIWSTDEKFRAHIAGGIRWAMGMER